MSWSENSDAAKFKTIVSDEPLTAEEVEAAEVTTGGNEDMGNKTAKEATAATETSEPAVTETPPAPETTEPAPLSEQTKAEIAAGKKAVEEAEKAAPPPPPPEEPGNPVVERDGSHVPGFKTPGKAYPS